MKIYVYVIYFLTSKKLNPYYIGITENLEQRMFQHLNSKYLVGNALQKFDNWIIKKLHTCKTYEEAFRIEIEEIRNFNCVAPNGYNLTRGGEGGIHCKETIEKIRKGNQGKKRSKETVERNRQAQTGKKLSKETIEKMAEIKLGKKNPMFGKKRLDIVKRNKENQGKKYSKEVNKKKGRSGKKNSSYKNGEYTKEAKIKRLKTRLVKLEKEN